MGNGVVGELRDKGREKKRREGWGEGMENQVKMDICAT
jgi:hypothetical protein